MNVLALQDDYTTFFETPGTTYPMTQHHIPENLNSQAVVYCSVIRMEAAGIF